MPMSRPPCAPGSRNSHRPGRTTEHAPGGLRPQPAGVGGGFITPLWRKRLLTALAIIVAAVIGILVAKRVRGHQRQPRGRRPDAGQPDHRPAAPDGAATFTDQAALTTTQDTTTTQANTQLTPQAMLAVLHTYLGFLPQHPAQAWQLLTAGRADPQRRVRRVPADVERGLLGRTGPDRAARGQHDAGADQANPVSGPTTDDFYNVQFAANGTILINDFAVASKQGKPGQGSVGGGGQ